jgi:hypothetical protein
LPKEGIMEKREFNDDPLWLSGLAFALLLLAYFLA